MNGIAVVQFGAIIYFSIYIKLCFFILITLPSVLIPSWPILPALAWDHNIMVYCVSRHVLITKEKTGYQISKLPRHLKFFLLTTLLSPDRPSCVECQNLMKCICHLTVRCFGRVLFAIIIYLSKFDKPLTWGNNSLQSKSFFSVPENLTFI